MRLSPLTLGLGLGALLLAQPVSALQHFIDVNEVYTNADGSVQYVELIAIGSGQSFLASTILRAFNEDGTVENTVFDFVASYPPFAGPGTNGLTLLVATEGFEAEFGFAPDFVIGDGPIFSPSGRILFQLETTGLEIDAVAYGSYTGPNNPINGNPAVAIPRDGCMSLTRISTSNNNALAWAAMLPSPTRTDGTTGSPASCAPDIDFVRGDANGDGAFSALLDGSYLLSFAFSSGTPPPCMEAVDVNGDGVFGGIIDGVYLLTHGFSGGPPPPPPYPMCGPDPDAGSSLGCGPNMCP